MGQIDEQMYPYHLIEGRSVVVQVEGVYRNYEVRDPNFYDLVEAIEANDKQRVREITDTKGILASTEIANGRVEVKTDGVYIDGVRRGGRLIDRIMGMVRRGAKTTERFTLLLERIENNPDVDARESVYDFIAHCNLPITADGCILAYKFVKDDWTDWYSGTIDNRVGQTLSMERSDVNADRNTSCAPGLHVCSMKYVKGWVTSNNRLRVIVVKVDPSNVVSVPYSYDMEKVRTCGYEVVSEFNWDGERELEPYVTERFSGTSMTEPESPVIEFYENGPVEPEPEPEVAPEPVADTGPDYGKKLNVATVRKIKRLLADDSITLTSIAARFGISRRTAARIRDGEIWQNVTTYA